MNSRKAVWKETVIVVAGTVICSAIMVGIFALLGYYDTSVLLGAVVGSLIAALNFLIMALATDLAADKAAEEDVKGGQSLLQLSYIGRILGMFIIWFLCYRSGRFNLIALVLPVLFTQPVITITGFFRKSGEKKA